MEANLLLHTKATARLHTCMTQPPHGLYAALYHTLELQIWAGVARQPASIDFSFHLVILLLTSLKVNSNTVLPFTG